MGELFHRLSHADRVRLQQQEAQATAKATEQRNALTRAQLAQEQANQRWARIEPRHTAIIDALDIPGDLTDVAHFLGITPRIQRVQGWYKTKKMGWRTESTNGGHVYASAFVEVGDNFSYANGYILKQDPTGFRSIFAGIGLRGESAYRSPYPGLITVGSSFALTGISMIVEDCISSGRVNINNPELPESTDPRAIRESKRSIQGALFTIAQNHKKFS